jgi:hypothetical protein
MSPQNTASVVNITTTKPLKVKAVPLLAKEALGGEEVQLLLILYLPTRWG